MSIGDFIVSVIVAIIASVIAAIIVTIVSGFMREEGRVSIERKDGEWHIDGCGIPMVLKDRHENPDGSFIRAPKNDNGTRRG